MSVLSTIKRWGRERAPNFYKRYAKFQESGLRRKVIRILNDGRDPVQLGESEFDTLQRNYTQWWPQYNFDAYSTAHRAYGRAQSFLRLEPLRDVGRDVLELACGDGMSGAALSIYGHHVTLLDYQDWRDNRAKGIKFVEADLGRPIPLLNSSYDFIFSFNAFEHIPDPALTMEEMVRVLRPGGIIWLDFNPLYASPLGLHAFSFKMPYPQFLFSNELVRKKLGELGLNDLGQDMSELQPLNHWKPGQFRRLWRRDDLRIIEEYESTDYSHLDVVLSFPRAFGGRKLSIEDLTVAGIRVILQKI